MSAADVALYIGVVGTLVCAVYAAVGYHRPKGTAVDKLDPVPQDRSLLRSPWIPVLCVVLTWAAVAFDYFTRPAIADAALINYGIDPSDVPGTMKFHGIVQLRNWTNYKDQKALLIIRTIFGDKDRMTDTWIAKSVLYTIDGPALGLVTIDKDSMRFAPNQMNMVEYDFAVLPPDITPDQIRMLSDIPRLGGKILAVNAQGVPIIVAPQPETKPTKPEGKK